MTTLPTQLGPYTIDRELGRGGMGVVYLGHDTKLDRAVAIKALPEHLAQDPDRLIRFEREARTLAQLNHPNVAQIYGVEEHDGRPYLVLEFVEGPTLAERLDHGALPLEEALDIGRQIAAGVEAAHEAGVIHRDLKPGNVKVTGEGQVKVLDFGLAKEADRSTTSGSSFSESPTMSLPATPHSPTMPGAILGTAPYMSPEQARGRGVDRRSDIWSFGVVLYECLTGLAPFMGETVSDSIGAILHKDVDLNRLPTATPPCVRRLIARCLERDKTKRLQAIGEARIALESWKDDAETQMPSVHRARGPVSLAAWLVALLATAALVVVWVVAPAAQTSAPSGIIRTTINLPEGRSIPARGGIPAFCPDGSKLALVLRDADGTDRLAVRHLESTEIRVLPGTEDAGNPFWSPDGEWIGFFALGAIKKIRADGRDTPMTLKEVDASFPTGADWNEQNEVAYATGLYSSDIKVMDARSGAIIESFHVSGPRHGAMHYMPSFSPTGDQIIFTVIDIARDRTGVYVVDRSTGNLTHLMESPVVARVIEPGMLAYTSQSELHIRRFDPQSLEFRGPSVRVISDVGVVDHFGGGQISIGSDALIAYQPGIAQSARMQVTERDMNGEARRIILPSGDFWGPRLSHDGTRLALDITQIEDTLGDIWVVDLASGTRQRLTSRPIDETAPVWSHDDQTIFFRRGNGIHRLDLRSSGDGEPLLADDESMRTPVNASPDGRWLTYEQLGEQGTDLYLVDLDTVEAEPWLATSFDEFGAVFDPKGEWIAYNSNESGRSEVYLRRLDLTGSAIPVTSQGARTPIWSGDGSSLFFYTLDEFLGRVPIEWVDGRPVVGEAERLFPQTTRPSPDRAFIDIAPDGQSIIAVEPIQITNDEPLILIQNWQSLLDR